MTCINYQDIWLLGTDRRFENLDMPILYDNTAYSAKADKITRKAILIDLPTDLPNKAQSVGDFLNGKNNKLHQLPFEYQLSLLYRYVASPLKYEPLNLPDVHFPVSSFGGLFSCGLLLILKEPNSDTHASVYRYHANYHALEKIDSSTALYQYLGEQTFAFVGIGEYWAVAKKYGEYAPFGVTLDVGIVSAQLGYMMSLLGWSYEVEDIEPAFWREVFATQNRCEESLLCLMGQTTHKIDNHFLSETNSLNIAIYDESLGISDQFSNLSKIMSYFAGFEPSKKSPVFPKRLNLEMGDTKQQYFQKDILNVMYQRTAANDGWGYSQINAMVNDKFLSDFTEVFNKMGDCRARLPGEHSLNVAFAWINSYGPSMGMYDVEGSPIALNINNREFSAIIRDCLYSDRQKYNLSTMMFELFISVDVNKANNLCGSKSIRNAHLAAGALVHDCCIAASVLGCFARPVRMFRDLKLEAKLNLDGQLLIQVLVGFNRHTNFSMRLL